MEAAPRRCSSSISPTNQSDEGWRLKSTAHASPRESFSTYLVITWDKQTICVCTVDSSLPIGLYTRGIALQIDISVLGRLKKRTTKSKNDSRIWIFNCSWFYPLPFGFDNSLSSRASAFVAYRDSIGSQVREPFSSLSPWVPALIPW